MVSFIKNLFKEKGELLNTNKIHFSEIFSDLLREEDILIGYPLVRLYFDLQNTDRFYTDSRLFKTLVCRTFKKTLKHLGKERPANFKCIAKVENHICTIKIVVDKYVDDQNIIDLEIQSLTDILHGRVFSYQFNGELIISISIPDLYFNSDERNQGHLRKTV